MSKVRWVKSYEFCGKKQISYAFQQSKKFENQLRFDKVTDSLKVDTFLRHRVDPT